MRTLLIVSVIVLLVLSAVAGLMGSPVLRGLSGYVTGRATESHHRDGGSEPGPRTEAIVRLAGSSVYEIELVRGGQRETLRESDLGWTLGSQDGPVWPVDADRVRAMLRLLADTRGEVASPGDEPTGARLALRGENIGVEIAFPQEALAGTALVRVRAPGQRSAAGEGAGEGDPRWLRIPDDLQRALVGSGFEPWRSQQAFALIAIARPARVEMARADARLELARLGDRWTIRDPVSCSADTAAVDAMLRALASVRVREFLPSRADAREGDAHAVIRVESDRREERGGEIVRLVLAQEVAILGMGGVSGETVRAITQITETNTRSGETRVVAGPMAVLLEGAALTGLRFDPAPLASKRSLQRPAGDVVRVGVARDSGRAVFERGLRGWNRAGTEQPASSELQRAIDACLAAIAEADASAVRVGSVPTAQAVLELDLIGGDRITLAWGEGADGEEGVQIGDGALVRTYASRGILASFEAVLRASEADMPPDRP